MLRTTAAAAVLSLTPYAFAGIVYWNMGTPLGTSHEIVPAGAASSPEIGNAIIVQAQAVNEFDVLIRIGGSGEAQFDVRARLYDNGAPNGEPGLLLWDSQPVHVSISPGGDVSYSFGVPYVFVADATWTLEITNRTGPNQAAISLPHYGPPANGNVVTGYWVHGPSDWSLTPAQPAFGAGMLGLDPAGCCTNDFNHNGEIVEDSDIEDFFRCLGGDCCSSCAGPDFNCDGDAATDADIESFFRVYAGGPC
jgi:hypothetical protein